MLMYSLRKSALSFCPIFLHIRYFLQPRDNGNKSLKPDDLGSLRLNVVYTEDHVFSSDYYSPLRDILLKSADVEVICLCCLLFTCRSSSQGSLNICHYLSGTLLCNYQRGQCFLFRPQSLFKLCISLVLVFSPCRYLYLHSVW